MKHIVIGSQAMKHHYPDFPRKPNDSDVIIYQKDFMDLTWKEPDVEEIKVGKIGGSTMVKWKGFPYNIEYLFANNVESFEVIIDHMNYSKYASPEILYSLKKGHIHFPIKFQKHIQDLMFLRGKLREALGITVEQDLSTEVDLLDHLPTLTFLHFRATEKRLGKLRTPNMSGEDTKKFFGKSKNYVTSYYVHDDMHKAIALMHQGDPIYEKILADGAEVETDPNLWKQLTVQQKIWAVLEEVYVIALERKVIPQLFEGGYRYEDADTLLMTKKEAFDWALMRVCTTLCDGFFREFAVRAYDEIQKQYNPEYVELFFKNIRQYDSDYEETTTDEN